MSRVFNFQYWPRYVARMLRFRMEYRGELMEPEFRYEHNLHMERPRPAKWKVPYDQEAKPIWKFSDTPPWDVANQLRSFPYPEVAWSIEHEDGSKSIDQLHPLTPEEQLVFKGDKVKVLAGPDRGKIDKVAGVLSMRRMVVLEKLNVRVINTNGALIRLPQPLSLDADEVCLLDPKDGEPTQAEWREVKDGGGMVRVSRRSGQQIPLPESVFDMDCGTSTKETKIGSRDTKDIAAERTYDMSAPDALDTFETSVNKSLGLPEDTAKRAPTYWY